MNETRYIKKTAIRLNIPENTLKTVIILLRNNGNRYTFVSKQLQNVGTSVTPRQIRYFYRRLELDNILEGNKPKNYWLLVRKHA